MNAKMFSRIGRILFFVIIMFFAVVVFASAVVQAGIIPDYLRCEYRVNPLGIDDMQPRLSWIVTSQERAQKQTAFRILVASDKNILEENKGDLWDSGKTPSDETAQIAYVGKPLASRTAYYWKVQVWDKQDIPSAWSETAMWSMGLLRDSDWSAKWIGSDTPQLTKKQKFDAQMETINKQLGKKTYFPAPFLRKEFAADKTVKRAMVYVTALGFYELYLNGRRVGNDFFTPGWTDYNKRLYYLTYDVTELLRPNGANVIGAILADGWYAGNIGGKGQRIYGSNLRLRAQLHIEYQDGAEQVVATDQTWRVKDGPIREADMQDGETYDARREMNGWNETGFDDSGWKLVDVTDSVKTMLQAYPGIPVRKTMEIKPIGITEPKTGVFVFNMGQNFAGCARLTVRGKAGDKVVLRFAEMLNADGTIYTLNLRGARVTDSYILKGADQEIFEPRFTYHGFQYVEITGFSGKPDLDTITGIVMHSGLPEVSSFETSDSMVNKLHSNILWGQRSNYFDVPTDCPQRDERLGWMGDAQVFVRTAAYNMDVGSFFTKWMNDVEDGQREDGGYPDVAPNVLNGVTAGWGDAGVVCPWTIYKMYGDTRIIERHYKSLTAWIEFLERRSPTGVSPSLGGYADWLNVNQPTDNGLISTAYFGRSVSLMAEMSQAVGNNEDAKKHRRLFERIRKAFTRFYLLADGTIAGDTQTAYLMALHFNLIPDRLRKPATAHLIENIKGRDWSLATGFLGGSMLLPTLTEVGRTDVAYRLLTNRKYPSWGYSIDQGSTTMWERWNSYTKENGFGDPGMNSFNHYAYGSVGEWMFSTLAGIDTDRPGFKRIIIRPRPGGGITWAKTGYDSIRGKIITGWKFKDNDLLLDITIPANTVATVYVPAEKADMVTESGIPAEKSDGVKFLRMEQNAAVFEVGSGNYSFVSKNAESLPDSGGTSE